MPDLDESVVHRSAGGGVHDSKVHEEFYSPVRGNDENEDAGTHRRVCLLLRLRNVLANQFVVYIVGTFGDFGGCEAGRLRAG